MASQKSLEDIYRRLAEARPDAFLPNLAGSLNNLGGDLSRIGRREEAFAAESGGDRHLAASLRSQSECLPARTGSKPEQSWRHALSDLADGRQR